jgi:uncharacterized membrane protein
MASSGYWEELREGQQSIMTVRQREARRSGPMVRAVRWIGDTLAHPLFFGAALLLHAGWVVANLGVFGIEPWDPPPFMLLATVASMEAPLLALLIMMRQQSDARVAELREETALQISLHTERQTTTLLRLTLELQDRLDVNTEVDQDRLEQMLRELEPDEVLRHAEIEVEEQDENQHAG